MTTSTRERTAPAGGCFMIGPAEVGSVFTPERLSDEHRAMRDAVKTFVEREVGRQREAVEGKDYATHRSLLERLGKDGYLGIDIPEQYGGAGLDRISSLVVNEAISTAGSFAVTYSAHTGIGTLPLVFFGTDAQKRRFLPGLADGSLVGAYALTEPSAGSDAMAIRTRATQQPDGSWRLDGSKQFITNAAFADLFTIYAKIDGEQPTFEGELAAEAAAVAATRTVTLLLAGAAVQRFGTALEEQEEILAGLADLAIDLFAMESSLERAMQATTDDAVQATAHADLASLVIAERSGAVEQRAKWLVGSLAEGDEARTLRAGVRRLLRGEPLDRVALIRRVAATVIAAGGYPV